MPELRSYPNEVRLSSHRNSTLSPSNCGPEGFQQVLAAVGCGASALGDDWHTPAHAATEIGPISGNRAALRRGGSRGDRYVEFWSQLLERVQREHPDWPRDKPHSKNDVDMQSPYSGTLISCGFAQRNRLRHELYIDSGDAGRNMEIFDYLRQRREQLEAAYGGRLEWEPLPTRRACRIADYKEGCPIEQRERFDEYVEWFIDAGQRLRVALAAVGSPG